MSKKLSPSKVTAKILFLEASAGGGHQSITQAIIQALYAFPYIQTQRENISPSIFNRVYQITSRQFINLWSLFYKSIDSKHRADIAAKINLRLQRHRLKSLILKHQPDLILSNTHQAVREVTYVLNELHLNLPFLVFVPDPFTPPAVCFCSAVTQTLVATVTAFQIGINQGIPPKKLIITGHPIRSEFYSTPPNLLQHRHQLKLQQNLPTLLFGGSGDGAEKTLEILIHLGAQPSQKLLRHLLKTKSQHLTKELTQLAQDFLTRKTKNSSSFPYSQPTLPFQALIITGNNTKLKQQLEQLNFPSSIIPHIYGKTDRMAPLIHASDLIIGKAGPNIIFESIAAQKPFLATYHIKGQENGNINFIKSTQVGFVEENPKKAAELIQTIIKNPKILHLTQPSIKSIRQQHQSASQNIAQQIIKHLPSST